MKRSFDYQTEEAFIKAISAGIEEVTTIRQEYVDWFILYDDLAAPGVRTTLLNYFDSILYLLYVSTPKIRKIFTEIGEADISEGKIMAQNNLEAEKYLSTTMPHSTTTTPSTTDTKKSSTSPPIRSQKKNG